MIDLHCHLLPGLDDGSRNFDDSVAMAKGLAGLGFTAICCTPHLPWGNTVVRAGELAALREQLAARLAEAGIALELLPGAEHHIIELPERLAEGGLIPYQRPDAFLMEFSLRGFPVRLDDLLFRIQVKGLRPAVAHVERYPEVQQDVRILERLRERGCYLLINLSSLAGAWDRAAQRAARAVVEAGLLDAACTDLHAPGEVDQAAEGLAELERLAGPEALRRWTVERPAHIAGLATEGPNPK